MPRIERTFSLLLLYDPIFPGPEQLSHYEAHSIMWSKPLQEHLGRMTPSLPPNVSEAVSDLTITQGFAAFVVSFIVVPRVFEVRYYHGTFVFITD